MEPVFCYRKAYIKNYPQPRASETDPESKISPALKALMAEGEPNQKYEAIFIHESPEKPHVSDRMERQDMSQRAAAVKEWSEIHGYIQNRIFEIYQNRTNRQLSQLTLKVESIGNGLLPAAFAEVTKNTILMLSEIPEIATILPNHEVQLIEPVSIDYQEILDSKEKADVTWGLNLLEIPKMWEVTKGAGINVGVIDTGVDGKHPVLSGRIKNFVIIDAFGRRLLKEPIVDLGDHGTHVCGTIAGLTTEQGLSIGVAPEAGLVVAAVPYMSFLKNILEGITWAVENNAHIINMSFGFKHHYNYTDYLMYCSLFNPLIRKYGAIPVVSVGNWGYGKSFFPGNAYNSFTVGAVSNTSDKIKVVYFSSGASLVFPGEPISIITKPDVVAPGENVFSSIPLAKAPVKAFPYAIAHGTSMASPHVAGAAALLMAAHPKASVYDVMRALRLTAHHPNGVRYRPDNSWGCGLIQPLKAHQALK